MLNKTNIEHQESQIHALDKCYPYKIYALPDDHDKNRQSCPFLGYNVIEQAIKADSYNAIFICSPYATLEAFKWLADEHSKTRGKDGTAFYLLTSKRNRETNPHMIEAAEHWHKTVQGPFFLKVYTETPESEDVMHAKLYLFVSSKNFGPELPTESNDRTISGYFGSCNFTSEGLGIGGRQNCEMLAEACDEPAKDRLRVAFRYFWKFHSKSSLPVMRYDSSGTTGCFV